MVSGNNRSDGRALCRSYSKVTAGGCRAGLTGRFFREPTTNVPQQFRSGAGPSSWLPGPPAPGAGDPERGRKISAKRFQEQGDEQLHQRIFGVMATFNTTRNRDALPLSTGQKYQLFFKSATDPWPFVLTAFGAGIDQAENSFPEYGQGMEGYAERCGAGYIDYFFVRSWARQCNKSAPRRSAVFSEGYR